MQTANHKTKWPKTSQSRCFFFK